MRGTPYFADRLGGPPGQAQLYLEAGLLHLEGIAALLISSSSTILSSVRSSDPFYHPSLRETGTETWRRDRDTARKYFERARALDASLDVPVLPNDGEESGSERERDRKASVSGPTSVSAMSRASSKHELREKEEPLTVPPKRRRRERAIEGTSLVDPDPNSDLWYLYLPGVVGAVIAVGVVGALSLTSWRKGQN